MDHVDVCVPGQHGGCVRTEIAVLGLGRLYSHISCTGSPIIGDTSVPSVSPVRSTPNHSFKNQTGSVVRPEKTWTDVLSGLLRFAGPTNKKPK
jgi:hypothetical protein